MMTMIISYLAQMNFVVTLLQEQHQCIDDDDLGDDHNHRYMLDGGRDSCYDLQKKNTVVLCVCIRLCVGSRGYETGDNSYEAQCG